MNLGDQRVRGVCEEETGGGNGRVKLRGVEVCRKERQSSDGKLPKTDG